MLGETVGTIRGSLRKSLRRSATRLFMGMDRLGVHILPKHYYSPVADYTWLNRNKSLWCRRIDMSTVQWDLGQQLSWLAECCHGYYHEVRGLRVYSDALRNGYGLGYGPIESQVLHCVCRHVKPKRIIEVGSGVSSACIVNALRVNTSESEQHSELICVEPFPAPVLSNLPDTRLVGSRVQELAPEFFSELQRGDILFIDSSHSVKTGSDVSYLLLEVLPKLNPGVIVHLHDIFLPYIFQRDVLDRYFDWQETALLLALLKGNTGLRVLCCLSALHYDSADDLKTLLPDYFPQDNIDGGLAPSNSSGHFPASTWLETTESALSPNRH